MIIPPIIIDTTSLIEQFNISSSQVEDLLDDVAKGIAAAFADNLEKEAEAALHQTRQRYINSILLINSGRMEGQVALDYSKDKLIRMIEEGASAFDMKEGFSKSSKVKYNKGGGWYLTIPFRWATPNAVAESSVFTGKMPSVIYKEIKAKQTNIPVAGGGMRSEGLSISEIPSPYSIPKVRPRIESAGKIFEEYTHKNSLYEGMIKQQDAVTGQNTYHSFRRASENSEKEAWIHPGIAKHDLFAKTLASFKPEMYIGELIDNNLRSLGFDI